MGQIGNADFYIKGDDVIVINKKSFVTILREVLIMQGLRTQESKKFDKFWNLVQETAGKDEKVFFADCGEGHDFETADMEGEDFCGWLIPIEKVNEFETDWKKQNVSDEWSDNMVWLEWKNDNGIISVKFNID